MKRLVFIIISINTILSCDSRKSAIENVVISEYTPINYDSLIGIWEVSGFNAPSGNVAMQTIDLNFDSSYIQFIDNQKFKFINMPTIKSNMLTNGNGYWQMSEENGGTILRLKSDFDLNTIPLDSVYYVVNLENNLTIIHNLKSPNIGLSFSKKKAINTP